MATEVSGVSSANSVNTKQTTKVNEPGGELGKDAFLQLLVTQMQYQDPLDPQDNSEYIAQLAQFSALEQMSNLNTVMGAIGNLVANMDTSLLVGQLSSFIDKDIRWITADENGVKTTHTGKVAAVKLVDGKPTLIVNEKHEDGSYSKETTEVTIGDITGIGNLEDLKQDSEEEKKKK